MAIAYGIALAMNWPKPHWAGIAVAMISLSTVGQSLNKGVMRLLGTLVGAVAALSFVALFPQDRWALLAVLSVYVGMCTYMLTGRKWQYAWFVSGFVCLVIVVNADTTSGHTFYVALERTLETGTGVLVYALVSAFLWPQSSRGALEEASRKLSATQLQLYRSYHTLMTGQDTDEDSRPLRLKQIQLLSQVGQALNAAATDSYTVWELRRQWRSFGDHSTALMETLERWRVSLPEVRALDLSRLMPNLEVVCSELEFRFEQIQRMLDGVAPARNPQPMTLSLDKLEVDALNHFQRAAVAVTKTELERLEVLSRSLFGGVADIKGYAQQSLMAQGPERLRRGPGIDLDRLEAAIRVVATLWIAFLIWVYVDPPGHESFVQIAATFAMVAAMMPQVSVSTLMLPFALGSAFAGLLYVFVMPQLSGYAELALMIFGATFVIYYLFWEPRHALAKVGAIVPFIVLTFITNEQVYSFAQYATSTAMLLLGIALVIVTAHIPASPRPEKVFLRLIRRFFRHSAFLMSRIALDCKDEGGGLGRWRQALYRNDLLTLPTKLWAWGERIDCRTFPANKPEQVQILVAALYALALRIKVLVNARDEPQAALLVHELRDDIRSWRALVEEHFRCWADDPERVLEMSAGVRDRLRIRLETLEARTAEAFRLGEGEFGAEDYKNFYRLLGSYRGLSESGIDYIRIAEQIDWAQWREARF